MASSLVPTRLSRRFNPLLPAEPTISLPFSRGRFGRMWCWLAAFLLASRSLQAAPAAAGFTAENADWITANLPGIALVVGIATILIAMVGFRLHAFLSLIIAALAVSCFVPGTGAEYITRVATEFGRSAGGIGIVIAMATIIGKCMLDSGAADRVVKAFLSVLGQKRAPEALLGSGFLLGIPVFFDTVFYLLVPLARSFYRQTNRHYLRYLLAISAGGAVTHTMVPPTPGPLFVAANLNVNLGLMIVVGLIIGIPSAMAGLLFAWWCDRRMPIEMRPMGMSTSTEVPPPKRPPGLLVSLLPVALPVVLISAGTILALLADNQMAAKLRVEDIRWDEFRTALRGSQDSPAPTPTSQIANAKGVKGDAWSMLIGEGALNDEAKATLVTALNAMLLEKSFYDAKAFANVTLSDETKKAMTTMGARQKPADLQHMNRGLLDDAFRGAIEPQQWFTSLRKWAIWSSLPGDPNMALIIAALVSLAILKYTQQRSLADLSNDMEESLLSGATIILITAAGGAFGELLRQVKIDEWVKSQIPLENVSGIAILLLAFTIAAVLKIAQGSSTVAMIVASSTIGAIIDPNLLSFNMVYVATTIASGSLLGSWMNDSGFWVYAKMGGLTEKEALKSWTILLIVLSVVGAGTSMLLASCIPLK